MNTTWTVLFVVFGVLVAIAAHSLVSLTLASRRPKSFPPGPPTVPILGNLPQLPTTKSFVKFRELGRQYGPLVGLKLGPQNMVILNDYKAVLDLFDRRGNIYSSRPDNHIANDILFQNQVHALFTPYGDKWRQLRRIIQELLRTSAVDKLVPLQTAESTQTLYHLLHDPNRWYDHIRRYSMAVMLASIFGLRGASFDSPRVKTLWDITEQNTAINELGATPPVDIFPFLKLLPDFLSPWRIWARNIRKDYRKWLFGLVRESREHSARPDAPDCFLGQMFRGQEKNGLDDEGIAYVGSSLLEAGTDTTASTILSFLLAMVTYPSCLRKCQDEVDARCGTLRSPSIDDLDHFPYIRACMDETLRWRPVAAGGIPHTLTQDDHYEGYFFPKGTMFFANTWSIHRSQEFARPDDFIPERFLKNKFGIDQKASGDADIHPTQDGGDGRRIHYVFGAGRRICSGQRMAEHSLMINLAKLVWAFNFTAPPNTTIDTSIETGYEGGFLVNPKKFPVDITPRSSAHAEVIEREMKDFTPFLDTFGK
ncbi:hypothetical protein M409DRAFT_35217 [Zasmidium cellare ATCC 36951]|uniref:Cytochrome P450 n=1 Tax=Zasmidium cellare ATCC 36951 TaxID=1080233 RepID=A0A6A6D497_ZASCE|nr:uncharacterized protein M409DRAFT_35217 [Zasmidium cellare ATCC 36951]KAF2174241.1 hypothetical protein M409DRAFT_35217 [Zasmidium cellare ATCC 36951]